MIRHLQLQQWPRSHQARLRLRIVLLVGIVLPKFLDHAARLNRHDSHPALTFDPKEIVDRVAPDHPIRRPFSDRCLVLVEERAIGITDPLVIYEVCGLLGRHRVSKRERPSRGSLERDARLEPKTKNGRRDHV